MMAELAPPENVEHAPVWLAQAIEWARGHEATDLHFFPGEGEAALWARIDGELRELARYPLAAHNRMVARLKVLGRCSEYAGELLQEGRFFLNGKSEGGEARLSIVPTLRGDKAVIRLLGGGAKRLALDELGFGPELRAALRAAIDRPQGLMLAVGPSGCGKSTAMYALLADLHARAGRPLSILTIEDPVEQTLPFAAQITADPGRGVGFAQALRAALRQDPEAILIGEIRDADTAGVALHASLTGHRLLSSMHTLSAAEALIRLRQMGAPPYVISSALAGVLNLRLIRKLCPTCRRSRPMTAEELVRIPEAAEWNEAAAWSAPGCDACLGSGHLGRTALAEWLTPTIETSAALQEQLPAPGIARTLAVGASARSSALDFARSGRADWNDCLHIVGLATMENRT